MQPGVCMPAVNADEYSVLKHPSETSDACDTRHPFVVRSRMILCDACSGRQDNTSNKARGVLLLLVGQSTNCKTPQCIITCISLYDKYDTWNIRPLALAPLAVK